ncbi:ubiquinone-dependent pyruvate dehydrogenase [Granulicella cerasi]|uniref:Pyruvate dehydrogenase [ubiquinone] n=1 Tax=Granulicella cerasi TaxID=741063 RepID=A0ABW1Z9N1_9BACT|nr:ubiquinone-dependent pyruvate dehydrogenase [Granulicella cerasi]
MATVAEVLVETLVASGVKRIYGLPGDSLNAVTETIRTRNDVQWVHVRHEEAAAFAAGAEAHLTGELTVCAGSCGPGNLHFINGLYDAHRSRVPVLALAAQIPTTEIGTGYFQETSPMHIFKECSHYCGEVNEPEQLTRVLGIAMQTAIAQRGVAVVILPGNIALKEATAAAQALAFTRNEARVVPSVSSLEQAAEILRESKRVTILAGAGCEGAHAELLALAEQLQAPIVHALRGKEFVEYDNPYDVGMTGLLGFSSGYRAMKRCDALLALGTDFPYTQFYPEGAKKIQVDVRGEQIGRRTAVDVGLIGTVKETIGALLPLLGKKKSSSHLKSCVEHYKDARKELDDLAVGKEGSTPLHPEFVAKTLNDMANDDAVFTVDVGSPSIWAARYLKFNGKRRMVGSWVHGTMACALPQALGVQAAFAGRQVISMSGDGGLAMLMGELLTAVQNKLPVKIVVFNNSSLAFVETEMMAAGIMPFGTELHNPNFADVATACGLLGVRVETPEQLRPALDKAFAHDGPALIDVLTARRELSMPPTITAQQAMGFGLYLSKCVLSGRGDEVLDLAKTNLLDRIFGD